MNGSLFPHLAGVPTDGYETLEAKARALECFETDPWAARAILDAELLTTVVWDPCCGTGVLSRAAAKAGYDVLSTDIADWGYDGQDGVFNFLDNDTYLTSLSDKIYEGRFSVFMNPPFSVAVQFVNQAIDLGARKVVCFQRFSWRESAARRQWWWDNPPARVHVCGDRATCWRFDIPPEARGAGASGGGSTPTTHAWFVWERGHPPAAALGAIHKEM